MHLAGMVARGLRIRCFQHRRTAGGQPAAQCRADRVRWTALGRLRLSETPASPNPEPRSACGREPGLLPRLRTQQPLLPGPNRQSLRPSAAGLGRREPNGTCCQICLTSDPNSRLPALPRGVGNFFWKPRRQRRMPARTNRRCTTDPSQSRRQYRVRCAGLRGCDRIRPQLVISINGRTRSATNRNALAGHARATKSGESRGFH